LPSKTLASDTLNGAIVTAPAVGTPETWTVAHTPSDTPGLVATGLGATAPFDIIVDSEICHVTATNPGAKTMTLTRGYAGSTPATHLTGAAVTHIVTGEYLNELVTLTGTQTLTSKTLTSPHMTGPVVDSGGLSITAGGLTVTAGNVGIGVAAQPGMGLYLNGLALTGAAQYVVLAQSDSSSAATSESTGIASQGRTAAAAYTSTIVADFHALNPGKGSGSTITSSYGLLVDPITSGNTNNYGVYVGAPSGGSTANYGMLIAGGTPAGAYIAGGLHVAGSPTPTSSTIGFSATTGVGNGAAATPPLIRGTGFGPVGGTSSGWMQIYVGTTPAWVAYWI
jgi:hypothetical protein